MAHDQNHIIDLVVDALDRDFDVENYDIAVRGIIVDYADARFRITIAPE